MKSIAAATIAITLAGSSYGQVVPSSQGTPSNSPSRTGADTTAGAGIDLSSGHGRERSPKEWFVHAGPAGILFAPSIQIRVGGALIPGAGAGIGGNTSIGIEGGLFLTRSIAASISVGIPPRATLSGSSVLAPVGVIGSSKYAPAAATAHYHFTRWEAFQPYVGGGLNYTLFFAKQNGAVADLALENRFGPVLQAGGDFRISRHWGVFADLKRIFVATTVTGSVPAFGGAPVRADLRLDPWIIHAGISYHRR